MVFCQRLLLTLSYFDRRLKRRVGDAMSDKGKGFPRFALSDAAEKVNLLTVSKDSLQEELLSSLGIN